MVTGTGRMRHATSSRVSLTRLGAQTHGPVHRILPEHGLS